MEGVDGARLEGRELRLRAGRGELVESGLTCRQAEPVACRYTGVERVREGLWRYEIEADGLDPAQGLVVDPGLAWSVVLSGKQDDDSRALCALGQDRVLLVATSTSGDLPGVGQTAPAGTNGYVLMVGTGTGGEPKGLAALYLGKGKEKAADVVALNQDSAFLTGTVSSEDLDPSETTHLGANMSDAYVAKLVVSNGALTVPSFRYLGQRLGEGFHIALGNNLAVGGSGDISTSGTSEWRPILWGVDKNNLSMIDRRVFGSDGTDRISDLAASGNLVHVAGTSSKSDSLGLTGVAGTGKTRPSAPGTPAGWVLGFSLGTVLSPAHFSWVGGSASTEVTAMLLDPGDATVLYVGGNTNSADLRTVMGGPAGIDSSFDVSGTETEGFVLAFSTTDWKVKWTTALGSNMNEKVRGLGWNPRSSRLLVAGALTPVTPMTSYFPGLPQTARLGDTDAFVTELTTTISPQQAWTRLLGGSQGDFAMHLAAMRATGATTAYPVVVAGNTTSSFGTTDLGFDGGVNQQQARDFFLAATDLTPPVLRDIAVRDGPAEVKEDLDTFKGVLAATWAAFDEKEDPTVTYQVGFTTQDDCQATGPWVVPLTSVGGLTYSHSADAGLISGTRYYAVVKASNSSGLSTLACSDGAAFDPLDGGVGLDARTPKPDTGRADPDTGAEPEPDTGAPLDASAPGLDAGHLDAALVADTGDADKQPVLGWGCGCGATGGAMPLLGLLLALGLRRRRR